MKKIRRLFLKQFFTLILITNFFGFKIEKKIKQKNSNISKKKSTNYIWYLNINDK